MGLTGVPAPCFTWPTGKLSLCNMYVCVFFFRSDTINSLRIEVRQKDDELRRCKTKVSCKYKITMIYK